MHRRILACIGGLVILTSLATSLSNASEESFVIKKKKQPSASALKEEYADELANAIRSIPALQKQLASLQETLIDDLEKLLEKSSPCSKKILKKDISSLQEISSVIADTKKQLEEKTTKITA